MAFFMTEPLSADKRMFHRVPIDLSMRMRDRNQNSWNLVKATDISAGGLGISSEKPLTPKMPLEMWLPIPGKGESYYTRGTVVWSRFASPHLYHAGVSFDESDFVGLSLFMRDALRKT